MFPTALIIGDTHFKAIQKGVTDVDFLDFINKVTEVAKKKKPTFIVLLGDILDSHEIKVSAHKLAEKLIDNLSRIAPTYILIGNHDYINNSQFLTDNHIFTPFKKWKNVFIADTTPLVLEWNPPIIKGKKSEDDDSSSKTFIFCPYTPPGRFIEALNTLTQTNHNWELADCIFAHQEFKGCSLGRVLSTKGDVWDENYPNIISGHIHDEGTIGDNIYYIGSAMQPTFADLPNKKIWFVSWEDEDSSDFSAEKISLNIRQKKSLTLPVSDLMAKEKSKNFNETLKKHNTKITLTGTSDEFKAFRKSRFYGVLKTEYGVTVAYDNAEDRGGENIVTSSNIESRVVSYREVFHEAIKELNDSAQNEYQLLFGRTLETKSDTSSITETIEASELVFVDHDGEEIK